MDATHDSEQDDAGGDGAPTTERTADRLTTHPTIRPLLVKSALLVLGALLLLGVLLSEPTALGNRQMTDVARLVVLAVAVIGVLRYFVLMLVLRCTEYGLDEDTVWRDFELLRRRKRREVPYERQRSCELNQGRIQALLGYGTISLNQGLGTLKIEHVEEPERLYRIIQRRITE